MEFCASSPDSSVVQTTKLVNKVIPKYQHDKQLLTQQY